MNGQRGRRAIARGMLLGMVLGGAVGAAEAQRPRRVPAAQSPEAMMEAFFDQMFGPVDDQAVLRRVAIPWEEEKRMGDAAAEAYLRSLEQQGVRITRRGRDIEYLTRLAHLVRSRMKHARRYAGLRLYVAESPAADARCFPGGSIVVFRGMFDLAGSEAAMIGVLGHELAHLDRQHQLQMLRRMKYASETFSQGAFSPDQFFSTAAIWMKGLMRPFRPEHESEADRDGIRWAYDLGYDPREFAMLFQRMVDEHGEQPAIPFFQTHPFRMDRYRDGMAQARRLMGAKADGNLYVGRKNLRERIPRDAKRYDE